MKELSPAASSAFVMWRNEKSCVVVDLRHVNVKLLLNVYSLLKQDTILFTLEDSVIFSSLDIIKSFFQVSIALKNRWKTSFVTSHCDHERLMIFTMRLANSSSYFQHLMKNLLKSYLVTEHSWSLMSSISLWAEIFSQSLNSLCQTD